MGTFFPRCPRLKGGRGVLNLFGQCPYRTNTFQKGASLTGAMALAIPISYHSLTHNQIQYNLNIHQDRNYLHKSRIIKRVIAINVIKVVITHVFVSLILIKIPIIRVLPAPLFSGSAGSPHQPEMENCVKDQLFFRFSAIKTIKIVIFAIITSKSKSERWSSASSSRSPGSRRGRRRVEDRHPRRRLRRVGFPGKSIWLRALV